VINSSHCSLKSDNSPEICSLSLKASILNPDSIRFSELTNVACDVLTLSHQDDMQVSNFIVDRLHCAIKIEPPWSTVAHMTTTCPVIGLQRCTVAESYYI
jgi:hypothetical protein